MEFKPNIETESNEKLLVAVFALQGKLASEPSDNYRDQIPVDKVMLEPVVKNHQAMDKTELNVADYDEIIYSNYLCELLSEENLYSGSSLMVEVSPLEKMCSRLLQRLELDE